MKLKVPVCAIPAFAAALLPFTPTPLPAQQNVSVVAIDPTNRLTNATVLGEWTTNGLLEGWSGANVTGLTAAGGLLVGDDLNATADASVSRTAITAGPDLDLGFNDFLQLRIQLPAGYTNAVQIEFGTTVKTGFATDRKFLIPAASIIKDGASHTYRLALGLEVWWRDYLRDLRITPLLSATGHFEIDYLEIGDSPANAPEPALNLATNFKPGANAANTTRLTGKHVVVWWENTNTSFTITHARRAVRMCEESFQVFCKKLGYNRPFREFDSTTTPEYKINFISWYGGYWAGGYNNRGHLNIDWGGLQDEGWGNPAPHEFGHVVQMAQPGRLVGGHWESHANYLRAGRNLHFYAAIPGAIPGLDNLTGNSNYRPDHNRHIYADQRYYVSLDDYGTNFGLPLNYAAVAWRDGARDKTLVEKLAASLPAGVSVKDVACESLKRWPMLDFLEKAKIRAQHWGNATDKAHHFWKQGAQLVPLPDKPGWWQVPLERAPDRWGYQMHDLAAAAGATLTAEFRGLDLLGTGEDWRWCFAAISPGDNVRYSTVWAPGTQSFTLNANETNVFLIVTATPGTNPLDLDSFSNTKPVDKHADRLRYAYEVRLVNAAPAPHQYQVANPAGYHLHSNGGGVVGPSATVAATAYVGPNAKVLGTAQVLNTARIEDYAIVQGSAMVQNSAVVSGSALVESNAKVQENARVRDRAWLIGGAVVKGRALVGSYTQIENTTVQDDVIVRGCAYPWGGTLSGTALADHDYSMNWSVSNGAHFSHIPWGDWWNACYAQTLAKPRGLAASYRTEETSGEAWWDEFGALHALLRGTPLRSTDATLGSQVVTFDGVDDYALLDRSVADTSAFSFSCRVKPANATGAVEPLLFFGTNASRALKLVRDAAGKATLSISNGTNTVALTSTSLLPSNTWSHIAFTLSGTSGRMFIGGVFQASVATSFTPLTVLGANHPSTAQANYVGRDFAGALFKGSLEDVRFYNVAMTDAEVRQEYFRKGDILGIYSPTAATDFNGTNSLAQSGVRNARVRTLAAWVKPHTSDDVSNYEAIFDSDDELSGLYGSGLGLDAGKWVARLDGLGNWAPAVSATLGQWQHVALAFNGSSATLFTNGVQAATRTYSGPASDSAAAGKCYRLGFSQTSENTATRQYFDGQMALARIHDRALTASQIVLDADGDGVRDDLELNGGSNPLDPLSMPPILVGITYTNVTCHGGNNGSIGVTASGGSTTGFSFSKDGGATFTAGTSPFVFKGLTAGSYAVVARDSAGGRSPTNQVTLTQPATLVIASAGTNRTLYKGAATVLGGSPTASAGTPGYTYLWSPATDLNNATSANPTAAPLVTTAYTVTVRDAAGCMAVSSPVVVTVTPPIPPRLTIVPSPLGGWDITWPDTCTNQLVWTLELGPKTAWTPVGIAPEVSSGIKKVQVNPAVAAAYYGLGN